MNSDLDRFVEGLQIVAGDPDWNHLQAVRQHCFVNGHVQQPPRLTYIEETPDRGRWIAKCDETHALDPGAYGKGPLCVYVSDRLSPESLKYLRGFNVDTMDLARHQQEHYDAICEAACGIKRPASVKPSSPTRSPKPSSIRTTYATTIPARRRPDQSTSSAARPRGHYRGGSSSLGLGIPSHLSTQKSGPVTRTPSIELVDAPPISRLAVHFFSQDNRPAESIFMPVGPQDVDVRLADHGALWKEHGVDLNEVISILVLDERSSLPTWSPVRLCDWAPVIRPRPLVAKRLNVNPIHAHLKDLYTYSVRGSLTTAI